MDGLEYRVATMNIMTEKLVGLYAITDPSLGGNLLSYVSSVLRSGASVVQYRNKISNRNEERKEIREIVHLCHQYDAYLIVNDNPELALEVGADGVHVGRDDSSVETARALLGKNSIIGVSCYDNLQAGRDAVLAGADYVAFGSIFGSKTKPLAKRASIALLQHAKNELLVPICAIGGITRDNAKSVGATGCDLIAVISWLWFHGDPGLQAAQLISEWKKGRQRYLRANG